MTTLFSCLLSNKVEGHLHSHVLLLSLFLPLQQLPLPDITFKLELSLMRISSFLYHNN